MSLRLWIGSGVGVVTLVAGVAGCSASTPASADGGPAEQVARVDLAREPASAVPARDLDAAVAANNAFAFDLYDRLDAGSGAATNRIISPLSASLALTMAYAGAGGQTAAQMATALHFDADAGAAIFNGQNALDQALASRGAAALAAVMAQNANVAPGTPVQTPSASDYQLEVVNSVWGEKTYSWGKAFLTTLAQSYGAGVYLEDFIHASEPTRQAINAWVSDETDDKINDLLLPSLDPSTRMVLVNALHVKFPWAHPFDPSANSTGAFMRSDGTTVTATFMNQTLTAGYLDDGQAQIAVLPLTLPNGDVSVVIALPYPGVSLSAYALAANTAELTQPQREGQIMLSLPKVTFTSPTFSLKPALVSMGMQLAFTPNANFTAMCANRSLYIEDVLQKTTLSMQETGVEAAAATAVLFTLTAAETTIATMVVNRPYLVAIVDRPTGALLFLGHIVDPTDAGGP